MSTQTVLTADRVPPDRWHEAAMRLVDGPDHAAAASRLLASAEAYGIDLNLLWATSAGPIGPLRQVVLLVPSAGRTAMIFLSKPGSSEGCGTPAEQAAERVAAIRAAVSGGAATLGDRLHLVQALPQPNEPWALAALRDAGMTSVGQLAYLRKPLPGLARLGARRVGPARAAPAGPWPVGVDVRAVRDLREPSEHRIVASALERTYAQTLDCPELCGLRDVHDVIDSHRSSGEFDPALWWIVFRHGEPMGCMLLNPAPAQSAVELVYIGLAPEVRGLGLARRLLERGLVAAARPGVREVTCAVDRRNQPALRLYESLGFTEFAARWAFVQPVRGVPAA